MGNQIMSTTAAIAYAREVGGTVRTNDILPAFNAMEFCFGRGESDLCSDFYEHDVPMFLTHDHRREIARRHMAPNLLIELTGFSEYTLTIHLRSGDTIWNQVTHQSMVQPPLAFYQEIVADEEYNRVCIISEDDKHPLLEPLSKMVYRTETVIGGDSGKAYARLMAAVNLVPAYSTFSQTASMLSPCIKRMYLTDTNIFQYLGRVPLPTWCDVRCYRLNGYTLVETWRASPEQLRLMVEFPASGVERVESF